MSSWLALQLISYYYYKKVFRQKMGDEIQGSLNKTESKVLMTYIHGQEKSKEILIKYFLLKIIRELTDFGQLKSQNTI